MSNALYDKARKAFADADIDMLVDTIKIVLVDAADYTVDLAAHDFLDDVPAGARIATSGALANKSTTAGVFDADDVALDRNVGQILEGDLRFDRVLPFFGISHPGCIKYPVEVRSANIKHEIRIVSC